MSRSRYRPDGDITSLETELIRIQGELRQEKVEIQQLFRSQKLLDQVTQEMYSSILKIEKVARRVISPLQQKQLKLFSLLKILEESLEEYIRAEGERLGICVCIDEALVDACV